MIPELRSVGNWRKGSVKQLRQTCAAGDRKLLEMKWNKYTAKSFMKNHILK
jgi:hypothetical protein